MRAPAIAALAVLAIAGDALAQNRGRGGIRVMTLTTNAFADGAMIPSKYAQPGHDVSPALSWTGAPDSVVSYVLIMHDADAATGNGLDDALHWIVWNIPGNATSLPERVPQGPTFSHGGANLRQMSVSGPYYRGPAAPSTGPAHHYVFELYALDASVNVQPVGQTAAATRAAVLEALQGHVRGKGVLVGLYRRTDPPQP
ncbi:MAG: YbhB/YbcL family Raf kinase inhibitor-like protein [Gemmatimonadota bacterium]